MKFLITICTCFLLISCKTKENQPGAKTDEVKSSTETHAGILSAPVDYIKTMVQMKDKAKAAADAYAKSSSERMTPEGE